MFILYSDFSRILEIIILDFKSIFKLDMFSYPFVTKYRDLNEINQEIQNHPDNSELWEQKGCILLKSTLFYDALKNFTQSIILDPSNHSSWKNKGLISIFFDITNDALQCLDKAISIDNSDDECFRFKAHAFAFNKSNLPKIRKCIDKALELKPDNISNLLSNALLLEKEGETEKSKLFFDKVLSKEPNNLSALLHYNFTNEDESSFSILKEYQERTSYDLTNSKDLEQLGNEFFLNFDIKYSELCYKKALKINPQSNHILYKRSLLVLMKGNMNKSKQILDDYLQSNYNDTSAWTRKGEILRRLNQIVDAIECFERAILLDKQNAEAWRRKGFTQSMRHIKIDEIIESIDKSLKLDPWHPMTLVQKALFLSREKVTWNDAFLCLDEALKIDPSFTLAWKVKCQLYVSNHNFENALLSYEKILSLDPDDVISWYNAGVTQAKFAEIEFQKGTEYFKKSQYDKSLHCFENVIKYDPDDKQAYIEKGNVLLKLNKNDEAQKFFDLSKQHTNTLENDYTKNSNDVIIKLENVSKSFNLRKDSDLFVRFNANVKGRNLKTDFFSLHDISFEVRRGEVLGIIGLNGSGKTTLLRIISGIYNTDSGSVVVNGTIAPILHIGTGFNGELNARENIIMYGMLLGLSKKEIESRVEKIINYAELEKFTLLKLKRYSSGMRARLAFAASLEANADILLIDEILAVGDAVFKAKSSQAITEFRNQNKTILYTTHNLKKISELSDRVLLLNEGQIVSIGNPKEVIKKYHELTKINSMDDD